MFSCVSYEITITQIFLQLKIDNSNYTYYTIRYDFITIKVAKRVIGGKLRAESHLYSKIFVNVYIFIDFW
ncbi:hypothetical protein JPSP3_05700 [Staphylococcus pseudintermedius]